MSETKSIEQMSLTELMAELKATVEWFNQPDVDVEVASQKFERGTQLAEAIKAKLAVTENKVNQIKLKLEQ